MLIRICKATFVAIIAAFFTLIALTNITDYQINYIFVKHVLAMDNIFFNSTSGWRAITSQQLQSYAYWFIISWEMLAALICWIGALSLLTNCRNIENFNKSKPLAFLGLSLGFILFTFGFIAVGGQWFQMWQSHIWNALPTAGLFMNMVGIVMIILLIPETL